MGAAQTITKPTFEQLPTREKVLIRAVLNALNQAHSEAEVEAIAFADKSLRVPKEPEDPLWKKQLRGLRQRGDGGKSLRDALAGKAVLPVAEPDPWRAVPDGAAWKRRVEEGLLELDQRAFVELRDALTVLIRTGRLPEELADSLVSLYASDVIRKTDVDVVDGHARFTDSLMFRSGYGAISYVLLRLSQLNSKEPILLICDECKQFKLIQSTGGDKISRFCSGVCRNRFTVREWRKTQRAAKHK